MRASSWQQAGHRPENKSHLLNRTEAPKPFLATSHVKVGTTVLELLRYKAQFVQYVLSVQMFLLLL